MRLSTACTAMTDKLQVATPQPDLTSSRQAAAAQTSTLVTISEGNTAPVAEDANECRLLHKLPAEMRNRIYREVLVDPECVFIEDAEDFQEPPLLQTCRQIRQEAITIYYRENYFCICAEGFNSDRGYTWCQRARRHAPDLMRNTEWCQHESNQRSADLRQWLQRAHEGSVPYGEWLEPAWIGNEFQIVKDLKDVSWTLVERVLKSYEASVRAMKMVFEGEVDEEWWQPDM